MFALPLLALILAWSSITGIYGTTPCSEEKVWIFGSMQNFLEFSRRDKGQLVLADLEQVIIPAVCKIANRKCKIIAVPISECLTTVRNRFFVGRGLMDRWFDGCLSTFITEESAVNSKFTLPYKTALDGAIFVRKGNPHNVDPNGGDFTLGVERGNSANAQCFNRLGRTFTTYQQTHPLDLIADLRADKVDAAALLLFGQDTTGLEQVGPAFKCHIFGGSVMTRPDSGVANWFNPAFEKLVKSGGYAKLCSSLKLSFCLKNAEKTIRRFKRRKWFQQ